VGFSNVRQKIIFRKEVVFAQFLDPQNNFREKEVKVEIRWDPLTDWSSRIVEHRPNLPGPQDLQALKQGAIMSKCPFCHPHLETMTPRFPENLIKEGRLCYHNSTVFPNAFPYDAYNALVTFSGDHWIEPGNLLPSYLFNGFLSSILYVKKVSEQDQTVKFASVNFNFMPAAGSGIPHPHLQIIVGKEPTLYPRILEEQSKRYRKRHRSNFWDDLVKTEEKIGERLIASEANLVVISCFAPRGRVGEILFLFKGGTPLTKLREKDVEIFSKNLSWIIKGYSNLNLFSFNMAWFSFINQNDYFWTQVRLIPRYRFPFSQACDVNYLEKIHQEYVVVISPEFLCESFKKYQG
jgi:galactose-1-phosphate uridylyltransferase